MSQSTSPFFCTYIQIYCTWSGTKPFFLKSTQEGQTSAVQRATGTHFLVLWSQQGFSLNKSDMLTSFSKAHLSKDTNGHGNLVKLQSSSYCCESIPEGVTVCQGDPIIKGVALTARSVRFDGLWSGGAGEILAPIALAVVSGSRRLAHTIPGGSKYSIF